MPQGSLARSLIDAPAVTPAHKASPVGVCVAAGVPPMRCRYNRHTMWPDTGSALTLEEVQTDLALLQKVNANYVRGAHYAQVCKCT